MAVDPDATVPVPASYTNLIKTVRDRTGTAYCYAGPVAVHFFCCARFREFSMADRLPVRPGPEARTRTAIRDDRRPLFLNR